LVCACMGFASIDKYTNKWKKTKNYHLRLAWYYG
jgi:hypothetical protein